MTHGYPYDSTPFVDAAVHEVYRTLVEAGVLVLVVILVFLGSWRATLVPATTVPVTIVGTFALMHLLGFSVNLLTLFGLVLAIGIVVDDAIVIVEAVTWHIARGLTPREATVRAMKEVTGPILGITLVLMAVFLPAAFLPGTTGRMYQQFALTIAATALLSAVNAIVLKPVQSAAWLRPVAGRRNWFSRAFDRAYGRVERAYAAVVRRLVRHPLVVEGAGAASRRSLGVAVFGGMITSTVLAVFVVPAAYVVTQWVDERLRRRPKLPSPPAFDEPVPLVHALAVSHAGSP